MNVVVRLQALLIPGGICVSGTVFDEVEGKLPVTFKFLGEQQVKNIPKPVRTYRLYKQGTSARAAHRTRASVIAGGVALAVGLGWSRWWRRCDRGPARSAGRRRGSRRRRPLRGQVGLRFCLQLQRRCRIHQVLLRWYDRGAHLGCSVSAT